jgi:hypothetical protein
LVCGGVITSSPHSTFGLVIEIRSLTARTVAVVLALVAGCGRSGFDPRTADAPGVFDAAPCTGSGAWGPPVRVDPVSTASNDEGPTVSADGLVLIFASDRDGDFSMFESVRVNTGAPFMAPSRLPLGTPPNNERNPAIAGSNLYFDGDLAQATVYSIYVSGNVGLAPPVELTELGSGIATPTVSDDELEMFYGVSGTTVIRATRAATADPWTNVGAVTELGNASNPAITGDGLTLYFETSRNGRHEIYSARRPARNATFSTPVAESELNTPFASSGDPGISHDNGTIYFAASTGADYDIYTSTRACP